MDKIEKYRKFTKIVQIVGMSVIIVVGLILIYIFGFRQNSFGASTMMIFLGVMIVMFMFLSFVGTPMQAKLLKIIIVQSLDGLVTDVTFNRKKGYSKDSFMKLSLVNHDFSQYGCSDYFSFIYKDALIESTTVRAYDEIKVLKPKGKKGKTKQTKELVNHFFGRVYIIPFTSEFKYNIYGKKSFDISKKKDLENTDYNNEYPLKIKKYSDNFEVFYKENKPTINMQGLLEKLLTLKIQSKGCVSLFIRNHNMVLCIDNSHYYKEVEIKKPIDPSLVKEYRKDVSSVLNFINAIYNLEN